MRKYRERRTTKTPKPRHGTLAHFRAFYEAADAMAVDLLVRQGMTAWVHPEDFYEEAILQLTKRFCEPYQTIDTDDAVHMDELEARMQAAHMIGFAMGLRLRGVDLGLGVVR